ncbi:uncharacterized protein LACBIDRAFT_296792 [Laccaria bicolor S238N-H82]|uniref:Predicted protein n=1 Tax=Laccaria bicolor (strain S238N-H82 / ATCC MYA-4686) TaxID=486041 RepID=B0E341_LACBS|nr:uncharacterized protein LACBIDRAFT_296792 [Laccaria bicolor S238N-H82]EDQ98729.1 predicted protein [Laccaria bicolor S238N-H82]|eukprot:XP_001890606.1 predicted protein [Laccaria bicolor S238N-H82]
MTRWRAPSLCQQSGSYSAGSPLIHSSSPPPTPHPHPDATLLGGTASSSLLVASTTFQCSTS